MKSNIDYKKYIVVFFITLGLFLSAAFISNYFGERRVDALQTIQDDIALDILSSETEFSLLSELSCKNISDTVLSGKLGEFGAKLEWSEANLNPSEEVTYLRKYYSLLQIKDYLLMKRISERCRVKAAFILYFYTNIENCSECERQGLALSAIRDKYPELRVYSFDYSTDLSAVKAMIEIYKIKDTALPALVIDGELYTGFHGVEELDAMVTRSFKLKEAETEEAEAE